MPATITTTGVALSKHRIRTFQFTSAAQVGETLTEKEGYQYVIIGALIVGKAVVKLKDGTNTLEVEVAEKSGFVWNGGPFCPLFIAKSGAKVQFEGEAKGSLTYVLVETT